MTRITRKTVTLATGEHVDLEIESDAQGRVIRVEAWLDALFHGEDGVVTVEAPLRVNDEGDLQFLVALIPRP